MILYVTVGTEGGVTADQNRDEAVNSIFQTESYQQVYKVDTEAGTCVPVPLDIEAWYSDLVWPDE